ncbi:MAG: hypothetical protein LQ343_006440 [Gyalolechia ehrenbergii]|nr:MAG: hypothetical protein LQ343_006440 [Gyalolechia ehrenbergii]
MASCGCGDLKPIAIITEQNGDFGPDAVQIIHAIGSLDLPDTLSTLLIWHPAAHWCVVEKVVQQLEFLITTLGRSNLYAIIPIAHPVAHMILTLKPSLQNGYASPHAYSPIQQPPSSTFSPAIKPAALPPLSASSPRRMGTPHRGLPPPSAMTLPNPERGPSTSSMSIGQLPAAPSQWHGAEESMRNWLQAKSEEERRKQEEQKTQQESLKLEQRRVEQTILRESLQGGIPPYMVPMVFAGMAGGTLPNTALEWAQHAMASITLQQQAQLQQQQQQQQAQQQQPQQQQHQQPSQAPAQSSSDQRRLTGPQPNPYGPQQLQQAPRAATPQTQQNIGFVPSYQSSNVSVDRARLPGPSPTMAPATSAARQPSSTLPRLNTVETPVQQVPQAHPGLQLPAQHPLQQTQHAQQQEQQVSSPIYFHHWVPPNTQGSSNKDPGTPTGKSQHGSPFSQTQSSYLRSDYTSSPKKRKATGAHHAAPAPSSGAGGVHDSKAMHRRMQPTILQAVVITEAGLKVDARAFQRPKAAVKDQIRRRLKHARAGNISSRLHNGSHRSAVVGTVPNGNTKGPRRRDEAKSGLIY